MKDHLAALDGPMGPFVALDIALDQLDLGAELAQVLAMAGGEVIEDPDAITITYQAKREIRADEPTAARDQDRCSLRGRQTRDRSYCGFGS
jgi:hypothetical protein